MPEAERLRLQAIADRLALVRSWPAIISLRNRIAHGYETVDHRLVWHIPRDDLPGLASAIVGLMAGG